MKIKAICKIDSNEIIVNEQVVYYNNSSSTDWKKIAYQQLNFDYPKFHKMDNLSKLAVLGVKYIEQAVDFSSFKDDEINMIFANKNSSYCSDIKHYTNYTKNNLVSPADFVYTLPNILIGEIAIMQKWYGENNFFIHDNFDMNFFLNQINLYFCENSKYCIFGWIESNEEEEKAIILFLEQDNKSNFDFNRLNNYL